MECFIKPRQDFTLSRIADALHCLFFCGYYPMMYNVIEKGKHIVVISIEVVDDYWKQDALEAIETLIKVGHFDKSDFTFIEPPSEGSVPEVD